MAERLCAAVNRYAAPHQARSLITKSFFEPDREKFDPPTYYFWSSEQVDDCLEWCDVVHFIHETSPLSFRRRKILGKKPIVYQRFTMLDSGNWYKRIWPEEDLARVDRLILVAEGWQRYHLWQGKKYTMLPMVFPIEDEEFQPVAPEKRKKRVSFAPMNLRDGPPAPKGVKLTKEALHGMDLDIIHRRPFAECMRRKAESWVGIDECVTPILHFSPFEYLALGVPCVSLYDDMTMRTVLEATGAQSLPIVCCGIRDLRPCIKGMLAKDLQWLQSQSCELRSWMDRYMHPRKVIGQYVEVYEEVLQGR